MDFEPHNFPALVTSVIRSDPRLAEPLKEFFAAYARNEDLEEIWARIDTKFHHSLRLILDDLNEIDDPVSLDQEVQVLLQAVDEALTVVEEEAAIAPESAPARKKAKKKASKPASKKAKAAKKPAGKKKVARKKAAAPKKAPASKKKKAAKPAKKKVAKKAAAKPAKKKAAKGGAKKAVKKSAASKKSKPARKKKK